MIKYWFPEKHQVTTYPNKSSDWVDREISKHSSFLSEFRNCGNESQKAVITMRNMIGSRVKLSLFKTTSQSVNSDWKLQGQGPQTLPEITCGEKKRHNRRKNIYFVYKWNEVHLFPEGPNFKSRDQPSTHSSRISRPLRLVNICQRRSKTKMESITNGWHYSF